MVPLPSRGMNLKPPLEVQATIAVSLPFKEIELFSDCRLISESLGMEIRKLPEKIFTESSLMDSKTDSDPSLIRNLSFFTSAREFSPVQSRELAGRVAFPSNGQTAFGPTMPFRTNSTVPSV
jgi:hypothetical protein